MIKDGEQIVLDFDEAVALLPEGDNVHTFSNPSVGMLFGADWSRESAIEALSSAEKIYMAGEEAQAVGHGLAILVNGRIIFIEAKRFEESAGSLIT